MGFELLLQAIPYAGAVGGALVHMVKKRGDLNKSQGQDVDDVKIIKNLLMKRPASTIISLATTLAAVTFAVVPEGHIVQQFISAFALAYASDSAINRPG